MQTLILAALVAYASAIQLAPLTLENSPARVPGEYVVIFETNVTDDQVAKHTNAVRNLMSHHGNETNTILREYHIGTFRGYGASMDDELRDVVRSMSHVKYVECSQVAELMQSCHLQASATWGIVRTTYRDRPTLMEYNYNPNGGRGVDVYIIDTGIYTQHPDFGGRAKWGADFIDNPSAKTDFYGHGTHVAGTVMSNTWGLARGATAIAVRVGNQNANTTTPVIIAGVNWVAGQHSRGKKSVANMSLGVPKSTALNGAVAAAVKKGVNFAVAAGNELEDACHSSPASSPLVVTVGASNMKDEWAWFSNYGTCVDIIAPGVDISSTWLFNGIKEDSGTSMASPHVAGVMAKYLSGMPPTTTPAQLKAVLKNNAPRNKITGVPKGTPNRLAFKECF